MHCTALPEIEDVYSSITYGPLDQYCMLIVYINVLERLRLSLFAVRYHTNDPQLFDSIVLLFRSSIIGNPVIFMEDRLILLSSLTSSSLNSGVGVCEVVISIIWVTEFISYMIYIWQLIDSFLVHQTRMFLWIMLLFLKIRQLSRFYPNLFEKTLMNISNTSYTGEHNFKRFILC